MTNNSPKVLKVKTCAGLRYWTGSILLPDREDAYELTTPELMEAAVKARDAYNAERLGYLSDEQISFAVIE